jgi:D-alanyl-D-alanine carboxypeptidase/D-alanyl-D-alanine-endopeptidase (penicillin-binding protein 4)
MAFTEILLLSSLLYVGDPFTQILKPFKNSVGFSVRTVSGKEIAQVNGSQMMPPASVAKTVSSACSLWALEPSYQFQTTFGIRGAVKQGVLDGDLIIKGGGDPSYVIEDLKENLERLYAVYGLKEIKGSLIFDTSYFEKSTLDISDDFSGDEGRSFRALLTPATLDFNSFGVWSVPAFGQARVEILPKNAATLKIESNVKIQGGKDVQVAVDFRTKENKVVVSGHVGEASEGKAIYRALEDPYASFAGLVARVWHELGGAGLTKNYQVVTKPVTFESLFSHRSKPLSRILMDINKLSTNFGAEMVLLSAGAQKFGAPASIEKAQRVLGECLKDYGITPQRMVLENASGLSRKSVIAPGALTEFLAKIPSQDFSPEYLSSLSTLGRDGTTKSRLRQYAGRARLKTGTIKDVRTIAGYVYPKKGEPKVFSLFFHCATCSDASMLSAEDEILTELIEGN